LRKESGFQVADRIKLYLNGNTELQKTVEKFSEYIKKETLTETIVDEPYENSIECNINGEKLSIGVQVVE
jgi:isoleucyl-tRNA synthetase